MTTIKFPRTAAEAGRIHRQFKDDDGYEYTVSAAVLKKQDPVEILEGMREIAQNDMLLRGVYVNSTRDMELADQGAVCGGHQACAVGAFFLAAGVPRYGRSSDQIYVAMDVGSTLSRRAALEMPENAGAATAYAALNAAAKRYMQRHDIHEGGFDDPVEDLFENAHWNRSFESGPTRKVPIGLYNAMLTVIDSAIRSVKRAQAKAKA